MKTPRLVRFVILLLTGLLSGPAFAQVPAAPAEKPFLRLETGMHLGPIQLLVTDAQNHYLVTGAADKTVRVWDASTGAALQVLRPPIGEGDVGKVHSVALSPGAGTIACSVCTAPDGSSGTVYLFRRTDGKLIGHLADLPNVGTALAFSPDGRFLAVSVGLGGIRVYRMEDDKLAAADDYGEEGYGLDWAWAGGRLHLATSAMDGAVRLYELSQSKSRTVSLHLLSQTTPFQSIRPMDIAFSPDGTKLAVGFDDAAKVVVLSARTLATLSEPDTADIAGTPDSAPPSLSTICWSSDGRFLYAGGYHYDFAKKEMLLRKWADGGQGRFQDIPVTNGALWSLVPRRAGGVFFSATDPAFGTVDADDACRVFQRGQNANLDDNLNGLLLSPDGATVRFCYDGGKSPGVFSLSAHLLRVGDAASSAGLAGPVTAAEGLKIENWKNTNSFPTLNGKTVELGRFEVPNSLAIAPDQKSFLLGTYLALRLFDRSGTQLWQASIPAGAEAVNISGNGQIAVAAYGDGTLRWYRMTDGTELFALFPHADRRRWVLWAPSGYYDCSLGGAELVGWQFSRGPEQAGDFVPLARYSALYRPDVLVQTLKLRDGASALRRANQMRPSQMRSRTKPRATPKRGPSGAA